MNPSHVATNTEYIAFVDDVTSCHGVTYADCVQAPLLLLTGPPGCGKTATIQVLTREMAVEVQEWTNPATGTYSVAEWSYEARGMASGHCGVIWLRLCAKKLLTKYIPL